MENCYVRRSRQFLKIRLEKYAFILLAVDARNHDEIDVHNGFNSVKYHNDCIKPIKLELETTVYNPRVTKRGYISNC